MRSKCFELLQKQMTSVWIQYEWLAVRVFRERLSICVCVLSLVVLNMGSMILSYKGSFII